MDNQNRSCPICSKIMQYDEKSNMTWKCLNECFYESRSSFGNVIIVVIFDKRFKSSIEDHSESWKKFDLDVATEIAFWKENDAYLAEILERKDRPKKFHLDNILETYGIAVINKNAIVNVKNFF